MPGSVKYEFKLKGGYCYDTKNQIPECGAGL